MKQSQLKDEFFQVLLVAVMTILRQLLFGDPQIVFSHLLVRCYVSFFVPGLVEKYLLKI